MVKAEVGAEKLPDRSFPWSDENEESTQFLLFRFIEGILSKAAALSQILIGRRSGGYCHCPEVPGRTHGCAMRSLHGWSLSLKRAHDCAVSFELFSAFKLSLNSHYAPI